MSNSGFETLAVFGRHSTGSETDSYLSQISESGFEVVNTESDSDTLSDSTEEQQPAHDDDDIEVESVHSTDAAMVTQPGGIHPEPWSFPEAPIFTEAVLSHPIFLKSLKADEILHLKHVCKSWATWFNSSTDIIAKVRRQNERSDWYFPVLYRLATPADLFSWTWSGIWHGTDEHSLETLPGNAAPPAPFFGLCAASLAQVEPPADRRHRRFVRDIVNVPVRTYRCVRNYWEPKGYKLRYCNYCAPDSSPRMPGCRRCLTLNNRNWEPLMVVNPLTKAVRFLPAPDCFKLADWDVWSYFHMQVLMRVNDEANSYEVFLLYNDLVFVYSSTSDRWKCSEFHQEGPWRVIRNWHKWGYNCASAWVGRRLFVADIRYPDDADYIKNPLTGGVLQVFEIDVEAGDWRLYNDFLLRKVTDSIRIPIIDVTGIYRNEEADDLIHLQNLELVECMGHLYAVIPARLDEYLHPLEDDTDDRPICCDRSNWSNYTPLDPKYMPLQFYILQLQGDSLVNDVLRIKLEPSATRWDYKSRRQNLFDKTKPEYNPRENWFSCVGKGSVIWVSCEDYLLQYDVVSGQTRTQVIAVNWVEENMRFAYRPSFHMKP